MKEKHYVNTFQAWYAESIRHIVDVDVVNEIYIYTEDPFGEIAIRWYRIGNEISPRFECFLESLDALNELLGVREELAELTRNNEYLDVHALCQVLEQYGFVDKTPKSAVPLSVQNALQQLKYLDEFIIAESNNPNKSSDEFMRLIQRKDEIRTFIHHKTEKTAMWTPVGYRLRRMS